MSYNANSYDKNKIYALLWSLGLIIVINLFYKDANIPILPRILGSLFFGVILYLRIYSRHKWLSKYKK